MSGFGGMVTIEVKGGVKAAVKACDSLKVAINAMSLGGVETLVSIPVYSSHINMTDEELKRHGVTPGMIRISVGVEGIEDLIEDFRQALQKYKRPCEGFPLSLLPNCTRLVNQLFFELINFTTDRILGGRGIPS